MSEILKAWEKLKSMTRIAVTGEVAPDLPKADKEHIRKQIHDCIFTKEGDIASRARAVELGKTYIKLSKKGREKFFNILARDFDVDAQLINDKITAFQNTENEDSRIDAEIQLAKALIPPRVKLLKLFNSLPNGFKFLIDFRAALLPIRKKSPYLAKLDADLKRILSSWFDIGLLDLEAITWQASASLLEKLMAYEAVHEIRSWKDLKNRLDSDRRCFAFFHNKIPGEPLIFVEVALVSEITGSVQELLDVEAVTLNPEEADTAVFYSISSTQKGLRGINLGNFLIKRVVKLLANNLKNLKHFVTLSPVPGFRKWLDPLLHNADESILTPNEKKTLRTLSINDNAACGLLELLESPWREKPELCDSLKPVLMRLCAFYIIHVKRGEKASDPVANFHLSNGARLERINWLGDTSKNGMKQSAGIMANYYYKLSDIYKNHELYLTQSHIKASREAGKWLKTL
ncbi:MAG: malonyl-CoA decarboxylase [bacterium]|nr:malonyl-CoA decarboxylase [bacterium]